MRKATVSRATGERREMSLYTHTFADRFHSQQKREAALERVVLAVAGERANLEGDAAAVAEPFDLDWHDLDPLVLDTLAWVTPDGDHWRWHGRTNNHGVPVVRVRKAPSGAANTEWTATRILHRLLVPGHALPGNLRQRCGADFVCVRPAHRCLGCS